MSKSDLIRLSQPDSDLNAYVIGGVAPKVSIHTQQIRAVNLIDALQSEGHLKNVHKVAIIGGGFAGLTCAAAFNHLKKEVTIYEKQSKVLSLQQFNRSRVLHPSSITWPRNKLYPSTNLPFLNWYIAPSNEVAERVERRFRKTFMGRKSKPLNIHLSTEVTSIDPVAGKSGIGRQFSVISRGSFNSTKYYDLVIITTGFPLERKLSGFDRFSYWEDRSVIPLMTKSSDTSLAVIGRGDGAIIDLMRCFWKNRDIKEIYSIIDEEIWNNEERKASIIHMESRCLEGKPEAEFAKECKDFYQSLLQMPDVEKKLLEKQEFSPSVVVFSDDSPFTGKSAPIHKCILGFITTHHWAELCLAKVKSVTFSGSDIAAPYFRVKLDQPKPFHPKQFDRVLERIGPSKGFCGVTNHLFETRIDDFENLNASDLMVNNGGDPYVQFPTVFDEDGTLLDQKRSDAVNDIISYLESELKFVLEEGSVKILEDKDIHVDSLYRSETLFKRKPNVWFGIKVNYAGQKVFMEEIKKRAVVSSNISFPLTHPISSIITPGHPIQSTSDFDRSNNLDRSSLKGVASYFVRRKGDGTATYLLVPKHVVGDRRGDYVLAVGVKPDGRKDAHPIAVIGKTSFEEQILSEREVDKYSCLNDIALAEVNIDITDVSNEVGGHSLKEPISASKHFFSGSGQVFSGSIPIGKIASVFNHRRFDYDEAGRFSFLTEVFSIACDGIDAEDIISGSVVQNEDGNVLGIAIGRKDNEIYCVESSKIHEKLDLELI